MSTSLILRQTGDMESEAFRSAIGKLIEDDLRTTGAKLELYNRECALYEERYGMSTADFLVAFEGGLGDEEDYFNWYGVAHIRESWQRHLDQMKRVVIESN